jgi:molybdopterin molybdotransferase
MSSVSALTFQEARELVVRTVQSSGFVPPREDAELAGSFSHVMAENIVADRNYPPVARSIRDGYALRAEDLPGELQVIGEVRAGEVSGLTVGPGQAIEIMTGAPVPTGADAIVMVEHSLRQADRVRIDRTQKAGDFINPAGAEVLRGKIVVSQGQRIDFAQIAMLASVGCTRVPVYCQPAVAILSTGDEVIDIAAKPEDHQVRNSNAWGLAAQVMRAGGRPVVLGVARDEYEHTRQLIEQGLDADLLLLSGGVSAGKYDLVEQVLGDLGAEFFFTRILIQPGQPLVFGRVRGKFFFGLPGNPASTMVTFEVFARAALELLSGRSEPDLRIAFARLTREFKHKTGLTRFLPARLSPSSGELTPIGWAGSSDIAALARSNCFLLADADRESWQAGELIAVLIP